MLTSSHLHMKSRRVCIKTRSPPASLPLKGQVTRHTTVKWPICIIFKLLYLICSSRKYSHYPNGRLFWLEPPTPPFWKVQFSFPWKFSITFRGGVWIFPGTARRAFYKVDYTPVYTSAFEIEQ